MVGGWPPPGGEWPASTPSAGRQTGFSLVQPASNPSVGRALSGQPVGGPICLPAPSQQRRGKVWKASDQGHRRPQPPGAKECTARSCLTASKGAFLSLCLLGEGVLDGERRNKNIFANKGIFSSFPDPWSWVSQVIHQQTTMPCRRAWAGTSSDSDS